MHTLSSCLLLFLLLASCIGVNATPEPIRIGVLYSSQGTMSISEARLKRALLVMIEEQNEQGGLLGRPLEAVVLEPASSWPLYAEKARQLIERERVAVIFGCWTSASRKEVKPVVEALDTLLFYSVQYEGAEQSENIFYLGATPNQQALPAVQFLMKRMQIERWVLAGTDYVYPRTINRMLETFLRNQGVAAEDIMISYTSFGQKDWKGSVSDIKRFASQGKKTAVISTINGDANLAFYREFAHQGIAAADIPVLAFSVGEGEVSTMHAEEMVGHLAAWNYLMTIETPENQSFIANLQARSGGHLQVINDPIEAQYIGFQLWLKAVNVAGNTDTRRVREAIVGLSVKNLSGSEAEMLPNHHITKPVYVGRLRRDGQFDAIWKSTSDIPGDPWFDTTSIDAGTGL